MRRPNDWVAVRSGLRIMVELRGGCSASFASGHNDRSAGHWKRQLRFSILIVALILGVKIYASDASDGSIPSKRSALDTLQDSQDWVGYWQDVAYHVLVRALRARSPSLKPPANCNAKFSMPTCNANAARPGPIPI